jgi:hypothetical protein
MEATVDPPFPGSRLDADHPKNGVLIPCLITRELLRGTRGLILWDPKNQFVGKDGSVGDRGREAALYFREIRAGLGALLIN